MRLRWIVMVAVMALAAPSARAGEWHTGESLMCGQCHVEHGSSGGQPIPGGPYSVLLLRGSINELCLSCHDGSDPSAPDVLAPVSMYSQAALTESSAGHFVITGMVHTSGHDLDVASQIPLNSAGRTMTMTCASCHDYHGNANYRNLRHDPAGVGDSIVIEVGEDVFWGTAPAVPPTAAGTAAAYNRSNIGYKSGWGQWCGLCHDQVAHNFASVPPAHFNAHPIEVALDAFVGDRHVDAAHWAAGTGEGFVGYSPIAGEGVPRVPFLQPQAVDFASSQYVQSTNQVYCGSCHGAHGTDHTGNLRWPYLDGGVNYLSGCQQCHNK